MKLRCNLRLPACWVHPPRPREWGRSSAALRPAPGSIHTLQGRQRTAYIKKPISIAPGTVQTLQGQHRTAYRIRAFLYRTRFNSDSATTGEQHVYKSLFLSHPVQFRLCRDDREQHIICKCLFCCTRFNPDPDIIRSVNPDPAQDGGGGGGGGNM